MKNALILHGTDFHKTQKQRFNNWFPWLKKGLEKIGYTVWLPELPKAWHPNFERYWNFLKDFDFNSETILIGHSSGATTVFGLLHKLPVNKRIKLAISVTGFYKDEGWNCEELFSEDYDWNKIRNQAEKTYLLWSPNDPYISQEQTEFLAEKLQIEPTIFPNYGHFNLEYDEKFKEFPEILKIVREET